jgi:hypothetical protein
MVESKTAIPDCNNCIHQRQGVPLPVIPIAGAVSAGMIEALLGHAANRERSKAFERQTAESGEAFVRPPQFFPWCQRYTPTEEQCAQLMKALRAGDKGPFEEAQNQGFEFKGVDYANGRVIPIYALCMRKNTGDCTAFQSR